MGIPGVITAQTGGRQFDAKDFTKYSGFVGGVNATHHTLLNYSPLVNGYGRLFMIRPPKAILKSFAGSDANLYSKDNQFIQFKHMLEYMNRSVTGFQDITLEETATPMQGGFAANQFKIPTVTKDATTSVTIGLYELVGSPVYSTLYGWMIGIGDDRTGLATYNGWISGGKGSDNTEKRLYRRANEDETGIPFNEANHTAEFIYVLHDRSGAQVERAVMLAGCYPTNIQQGAALDMPVGGTHDVVTYDVTFNCSVYRSPIITSIANDLLKQYRIVANSYNFNPGAGDAVYSEGDYTSFNSSLGDVPTDFVGGTEIGNVPVYDQTVTAKTTVTPDKDINKAKLAGQESYQM